MLITRPYKFCFSKNDITYKFLLPSPDDDGCMLNVQLFIGPTGYGVAPSEMVYEISLRPGAGGLVTVNLQDIIDSCIPYVLPAIPDIVAAVNLKDFFIKYRKITTADPDAELISDGEHIITAIKGGIQKLYEPANNYFIYRYPDEVLQPFNTWQKDKTFVGLNDDFFISWLCLKIIDSIAKVVRVIAYDFSGNPSDPIDLDILGNGEFVLYHIPAGVNQLGLLPLTGATGGGTDIWYYTLQVKEKDDNVTYSDLYAFYVDYRNFYKTKIFNFYNSLGGLDHVRILGVTEDDYSRDIIESELFQGQIRTDTPPTEYQQSGLKRLDQFKTDVGYRHTAEQVAVLKEIFTSALIWEYYSKMPLRIFITSKSGKVTSSDAKRFNLPIEWRYGYVEPVYTPESFYKKIGEGITCNITLFDLIITPLNNVEGTPAEFQANWQVYGNFLIDHYDLEFSLDDGLTWAPFTGAGLDYGQLQYSIEFEIGIDEPDYIPHQLRITPYCTAGSDSPGTGVTAIFSL